MISGSSNMSHGSPPSHPVLPPSTPASPPSKRDLKSWWKNFKLPSKHQEAQHETRGPGIFGVPLRQSITYANVAISLVDENGQSYIYGYVPIVVAKCGVFLKEKATSIEGIFRLSGSEKRIKELKTIFDSPDRYGKGLVWDGYTVHDAANVLRRYLNDLPEPVVPLDLYEKFRDPLRGATKQAVGDAEGPQFVENFNEKAAIEKYQRLITELPPLNKQLLLYILDLLAVFAAKSDENRMNSQNLAAIFQPGMLSHPAHAMAPEEYRLNQCVIIFLIENQDHFLIGMQGTAADEKTMKEVASGTPNGPHTPNPNRKSGLGRTDSNASAGAESVRRDGKIRRNRSVSSRHSRADGSITPNSPAVATTPTGGLGRSNTVPSKKSPALVGGKFKKHESPGRGPHSPAFGPLTQVHPVEEKPVVTPAHTAVDRAHLSPEHGPPPSRSQERLLEVPQETLTPTKDRNVQNLHGLFQRSPIEGGDKRLPNKLKKKRIPGSMNISAQSSCASLPQSLSNAASPGQEVANPLETIQPISQPMIQSVAQPTIQPAVTQSTPQALPNPSTQSIPQPVVQTPVQPTEPQRHPEQQPQQPPLSLQTNSADLTPRNSQVPPAHNSLRPEDIMRGKKSPPASLNSSFNEGSDLDHVIEESPVTPTADSTDKEKKSRWRLSRSKKEDFAGFPGSPVLSAPHVSIGSNNNAEASTLSFGSAANKPRKSFTGDSSEQPGDSTSVERLHGYDSGRDSSTKDDPKGPIGWIRSKYREAKENVEQRRNKSPPADHHHHHHHTFSASRLAPRGKSLDLKRDQPREEEKPGSRDAQKEALKEVPKETQPSQEASQVEATRKEPVQATIYRVISQTETVPTEPTPKETNLQEVIQQAETQTAVSPQADVQQQPPQSPQLQSQQQQSPPHHQQQQQPHQEPHQQPPPPAAESQQEQAQLSEISKQE